MSLVHQKIPETLPRLILRLYTPLTAAAIAWVVALKVPVLEIQCMGEAVSRDDLRTLLSGFRGRLVIN